MGKPSSAFTAFAESPVDALEASGAHRLFQEQISTRVRKHPEMKAALAAAREYRSLGTKVTLVVHEMKRLGRGALELLEVAEELRDAEIELEFLTGPLAGKHDPAGHGAALFAFFAAMAESERDYIRDKTLEDQETARTKGKAIGGVKDSNEDMHARRHARDLRTTRPALRNVDHAGRHHTHDQAALLARRPVGPDHRQPGQTDSRGPPDLLAGILPGLALAGLSQHLPLKLRR
ncbi:recombinase family protein [Streptomyces sp. NPDC058239]|uniref:recombinase family protein n=1 Tax=Streptomyces sp. NPDC058239 TaxID=3346395 RepID=UPI0036E542B0